MMTCVSVVFSTSLVSCSTQTIPRLVAILFRRDDWPEEIALAIREQRVELDMSMQQVAVSIGWPEEWPWFDARRRPIGMDGDDLAYHNAVTDMSRWTYRYPEGTLRVWFMEGRVYRIMDDRTGRIEDTGD